MIIYVVEEGDTITSIAGAYGVPPSRIVADNELTDPSNLVVGQDLLILFPTQVYTVRGGDTLFSISEQFGVSYNQLWRNNPILGGKTTVYPGQTLNISYNQPNLGSITVNGYAYTFTSEEVLRKTLPYLTFLSIFSYGITSDGEIIIPDDTRLISLAREYDVSPIMTLTALTEGGTYSVENFGRIISDDETRSELCYNILGTIRERGLDGADIDVEYIPAIYRDDYITFLTELKSILAPEGYSVFVALSPKTRDDQPGLLYEGINYAALGDAADAALIMTYEWGYTYGPPMAIAPINSVEDVVRYAVSRIPPNKIFLGVPNYAYDWPLPYIRGETKADSMSNNDAINLARNRGVAIQFDETSASPFFNYTARDSGSFVNHEVWFENARSYNAKFELLNEYGLKGMSIWNIRNFYNPLYSLINQLFIIAR